MKLKRYLVFWYSSYYPDGGWNDFVGSYDTIDEAKKEHQPNFAYEHVHIVDLTDGQKVYCARFDNKTSNLVEEKV